MKVKVKICGNKRIEDALQAVSYGADAIGLLVGQLSTSRDFISPELAQTIVKQLPPFISSVLVTHLTGIEEVIKLTRFAGVNTLQLHGESPPEDIFEIKNALPFLKVIKSLHVVDDKSHINGKKYVGIADAVLLDSLNKATNQIGGTGKTHDWNISRKIVEEYNTPIILAGGLSPDNVKQAIEFVRPYAVDVNSGVRGDDGFKDYKKLEKFIKSAKEANI